MKRKILKNKPPISETAQQWQPQQQIQQQQEQQRQQQQQEGKDVISEEMIITGMIEHDIFVQMPPNKRYTIKIRGFRRKKAEPRIVLPEWL